MSPSTTGRIVALALVVLAPLVGFVPATSAAEPSPTGQAAFGDVAGCISTADNVLVSVVVDQSLSLRETDPEDLRVRGITTAIDSLEQLASSIRGSTRVHVSLSAFARTFDPLVDWRRLDATTSEELRTAVTSTLPDRDTGDATDYRQALLGAQRQLDEQQRRLGDPDACKVLLWFTDGALDVEEDTDVAATELCQVGGIADAVRSDDITVVALALFTPGADVTPQQREQLRAVAEGRSQSGSCGQVPLPAGSAQGVYLPAGDPAALQQLFAGAGALVGGGTEVGTISCPGPQCRDGVHPLVIDPGVAGARVLITTGSAESGLTLTTPSGRTVRLSGDRSVEVDGATVEYFARDQLATLDISYPDYSRQRDRWLVAPPTSSELAVYWFWGAELRLDTTELRAGATNELRLRLVDKNGAPLDPALYDRVRATLQAGGQDVPTRLTGAGEFAGTLELGVDDLPPALPVVVRVQAASSPGGVALGPLTLTERMPVALPPAYPSVSPTELDFGRLEGPGTATAELTVQGSELGTSRVCLTGSTVTLPGDTAGEAQVTAPEQCVDVARGETEPFALELAPTTSVDGVATGELTVAMEPADGSEPLELNVPVRLDMERPVDESTRWALVAALVALAVLLPLLLLVLTNLLLGRFVMTATSRTATRRVRVTPTGLRPLTGTQLVEPADLENARFSGRRSNGRLPVEGTGLTLQARRILSLREPVGVAVGPPDRLLVSGRTPHRGGRPHEAPVGLGDVDAAFVVIDPGGTTEEADGTLVLVVPESVSYDGIQHRAQQLSDEPEWGKHLAEAVQGRGEPVLADVPTGSGHSAADAGAAPAPTEEPPSFPWDTPEPDHAPRTKARPPSAPPSAPPSGSPRAPDPDDDDTPPLPDFLR